MIDVRAAVRNAVDHFHSFPEFIPTQAVRLETEYDDGGYCLIALSTLGAADFERSRSLQTPPPGMRTANWLVL